MLSCGSKLLNGVNRCFAMATHSGAMSLFSVLSWAGSSAYWVVGKQEWVGSSAERVEAESRSRISREHGAAMELPWLLCATLRGGRRVHHELDT